MSLSIPTPRLVLAVVAAAIMGAFAVASSAQAACAYPDAEQVFSKWGDTRYYELAPDGGFEEGGNGWSFSGGAALVNSNETQFLNGPEDEYSLSLPYGSEAVSPRVCIDESTPVFRVMALNGGVLNAKLRVTVSYEVPKGTATKTKDIRAEAEWAPSEPLKLEAPGEMERVARISFVPTDAKGNWLIDDLYIDPFSRR
jgi:hypothetical protein